MKLEQKELMASVNFVQLRKPLFQSHINCVKSLSTTDPISATKFVTDGDTLLHFSALY